MLLRYSFWFVVCSVGFVTGRTNGGEFFGLGAPNGENWSRLISLSADGRVAVGASSSTYRPPDSSSAWPEEKPFSYHWTTGGPIDELPKSLLETGTMVGFQRLLVSGDGGVIAGWSNRDAYIWSLDAGLETLPRTTAGFPTTAFCRSFGSNVTAMSDDGSMVFGEFFGYDAPGQGCIGRPFRWTREEGFVDLTSRIVDALGPGHAWVESTGTMQILGVSGDGSVLAGTSRDTVGDHGWINWLYDDSTRTSVVLPSVEGTDVTSVTALSADGRWVLGRAWPLAGGPQTTFRWSLESGLDVLPFATVRGASPARDLSADGSIIVGLGEDGPFLWTEDLGMRLLVDELVDRGLGAKLAGWQLEEPLFGAPSGLLDLQVSHDGLTIAGTGTNPAGNVEAWIALLAVPECDVNGDEACNVADIDLIFASGDIAAGVPADGEATDINGDGTINTTDVNEWLATAATVNGFGAPYLIGDANLDGDVDAEDLNAMALQWQSSGSVWSTGDFTGEGDVGAADLNALAIRWQQSNNVPAAPIPEPSAAILLVLGVVSWTVTEPRHRAKRHRPKTQT